MKKTERNPDGTFRKGSSGNRAGRPPKERPRHRMPAHNRSTVFEVAETQVQIRVGDELVEASVYRGVLMAMAKKAMTGHTPSAKLFLTQLHTAAEVNGQMNEFTRWMVEEQRKMQTELDEMRSRFPRISGGVMIQGADGSVVPAAWANQKPPEDPQAD